MCVCVWQSLLLERFLYGANYSIFIDNQPSVNHNNIQLPPVELISFLYSCVQLDYVYTAFCQPVLFWALKVMMDNLQKLIPCDHG